MLLKRPNVSKILIIWNCFWANIIFFSAGCSSNLFNQTPKTLSWSSRSPRQCLFWPQNGGILQIWPNVGEISSLWMKMWGGDWLRQNIMRGVINTDPRQCRRAVVLHKTAGLRGGESGVAYKISSKSFTENKNAVGDPSFSNKLNPERMLLIIFRFKFAREIPE